MQSQHLAAHRFSNNLTYNQFNAVWCPRWMDSQLIQVQWRVFASVNICLRNLIRITANSIRAWSKLRLCSANHRPGYWSNLPCDCPSIACAYSEQETENGPWYMMSSSSDLGWSPGMHLCRRADWSLRTHPQRSESGDTMWHLPSSLAPDGSSGKDYSYHASGLLSCIARPHREHTIGCTVCGLCQHSRERIKKPSYSVWRASEGKTSLPIADKCGRNYNTRDAHEITAPLCSTIYL